MRRMEQRKSKQDSEQKLHPIQCSATVLRQLGLNSAHTNRQLVNNPVAQSRKNAQKNFAPRMPYKRRTQLSGYFSIPGFWCVSPETGLFQHPRLTATVARTWRGVFSASNRMYE